MKKATPLIIGAGGSTPKPVYQALADKALAWPQVFVGQVDERFVAKTDSQSNTLMMQQALRPAIDKGLNFISLIEDEADIDICVSKAQTRLSGLLGMTEDVIDYGLLGMGQDAHYASLFPNHPINDRAYETSELILAVTASGTDQEPRLARLSLSVAALNRVKTMVLFITGQAKLDVLKHALLSDCAMTAPIGAFLNQYEGDVTIVWTDA